MSFAPSPAPPLTLAIVREGASLWRFESYAACDLRPPQPGARPSDFAGPYAERRVPFGDAAAAVGGPDLASAWAGLAKATLPSARTLALATLVTLETLPEGAEPAPPLPRWGEPRAVAARPPAAPGEKAPAARPPRGAPRDVRAALGGAGALRGLCEGHGGRARERALTLLSEYGYDKEQVRTAWRALLAGDDPYLAYHHGAAAVASVGALPRPFVRSLLGPARGQPWGRVRALVGHYADLGLGEDGPLRAVVARLVAALGLEAALAWLAVARGAAAPRRLPLLSLALADSAARRADPRAWTLAAWAEFEALCPDEGYGWRVAGAIGALGAGAAAGRVLAGLRAQRALDPPGGLARAGAA